jgi:serine/threonine protein kinase
MTPGPCPSPEQLTAYLRGQVTSEALETLAVHLERCRHCEARAAALEPQLNPLLERLRRPAPELSGAERDELRRLTGRAAEPAPGPQPRRVGKFELVAQLGKGGFGAVWRARDTITGREVALKLPHPERLRDPGRVDRFLREARASARLVHPHIVRVYEVDRHGDGYYIASELVRGGTLADLLARGRVPLGRSVRIVRCLAEALHHAHGLGIVHRDVKPLNVLLDEAGEPRLTDFGLAFLDDASEQTQEGAVMGTPAYMPPEQVAGRQDTPQPAADQYSLGVVLYQALCGRLPFEGPTRVVLARTLAADPPPPRVHDPQVPAELERACLRALAKRPQDRFPDCRALADALGRWLDASQTGTAAEPARPGPPAPPRPPARPASVATLAAGPVPVAVPAPPAAAPVVTVNPTISPTVSPAFNVQAPPAPPVEGPDEDEDGSAGLLPWAVGAALVVLVLLAVLAVLLSR